MHAAVTQLTLPHIVDFSSFMWYGTAVQHVTHCYVSQRHLLAACGHGRFPEELTEFHAFERLFMRLPVGANSREMGDLQ